MASQPALFNFQALKTNGDLGASMRLYTYEANTTTHKAVYTDAAGLVPHTYTNDGLGGQFIALNARGELPDDLYMGAGVYTLTLKDAAGATVWSRESAGLDAAIDNLRDELATDDDNALGAGLVGFGGAETYAVGTVGGKLNQILDAEDFGASPLASAASNTTAINAALTAATSGQTVTINTPGVYQVIVSTGDTAIVVPQGVNLIMAPGAWLTKTDADGSVVTPKGRNILTVNIDGNGYPLSGGVAGSWTIENVGIRCYEDASLGLGATDVIVRDGELKNLSYGIQAHGAQRWRVYGNRIHRTKLSGVLMGFYSGYDCAYNILSGNTFEDHGDYAIAFYQVGGEANGNGVHNIVANNVAKDCNQRTSGYAFGVEQGDAAYQRNFAFVGNVYLDTVNNGTYGHGGIVMATCTNSIAIGNNLRGSLGSSADVGVQIYKSVGTLVADNIIERFRGSAVSADGTTDCTIRGNQISDCGTTSPSYATVVLALNESTRGTMFQGNSLRWSDSYPYTSAGAVAVHAAVATGKSVERLTIDGNTIHNAPQLGVYVSGLLGNLAATVSITRNVMTGDALFLNKGFEANYCSSLVVKDNVIRDAGAASTVANSSGAVVSGNIGHVTENRGITGAISTGATVNHGLVGAPTFVLVTPAETGPTDVTVSAVGATTFVINFGGGGSKTFYWQAAT